jgi:hypothetical protein
MPTAFDHHQHHFRPVLAAAVGLAGHCRLIATFGKQVDLRVLSAAVRLHPRPDRVIDGTKIRAGDAFLAPAAHERNVLVLRAVEVQDRHRTFRLADFSFHGAGHRGDGSDSIREFRGKPVRHDRPVRHARGVDSLGIDRIGPHQVVQQCANESHVVHLVLRRRAAAVAPIPEERRVGAGPVRVYGDEACLIGLSIQTGKPRHHRAIHRRTMQGQNHWQRRFLVVVLRGVDEVCAVQASYGDGSGLPWAKPP